MFGQRTLNYRPSLILFQKKKYRVMTSTLSDSKFHRHLCRIEKPFRWWNAETAHGTTIESVDGIALLVPPCPLVLPSPRHCDALQFPPHAKRMIQAKKTGKTRTKPRICSRHNRSLIDRPTGHLLLLISTAFVHTTFYRSTSAQCACWIAYYLEKGGEATVGCKNIISSGFATEQSPSPTHTTLAAS